MKGNDEIGVIINVVAEMLGREEADAGGLAADDIRNGSWQQFRGDGSNRRFWRVAGAGGSLVVIAPEHGDTAGRREAEAAWHIGCHLHRQGVPVPRIFGFDPGSGVLVCEDLGRNLLYDLVVRSDWNAGDESESPEGVYRSVIDVLVTMQRQGARGFDRAWCWDTETYDRRLMLERESGYFLQAYWRDLLGKPEPAGIHSDFALLADRAAAAPGNYFLHRDFQSRNIMLQYNQVRVIDYQGGRLGPLAYDLASLLIDPYVQLPVAVQERLLAYYLDRSGEEMAASPGLFREQYCCLAIQRNLQVIGAFAFLSNVRGKMFFAGYLQPALQSLHRLLADPAAPRFIVLPAMVEDAQGAARK